MWDAFKDLIFQIIQFFYNFCGDWGLAIIIVTVIFRVLISPLMHKQTKSSFQMQKVQPLMKEIQTKYADDPQRQQEEMQKLYAEVKFNPLAGCLPMLLANAHLHGLVPGAFRDGCPYRGLHVRVL